MSIEALLTKIENNRAMNAKPSKELLDTIMMTLAEYDALQEKLTELRRYLELPKFQGTELVKEECPDCYCKLDRLERKDWVSVADIMHRLF